MGIVINPMPTNISSRESAGVSEYMRASLSGEEPTSKDKLGCVFCAVDIRGYCTRKVTNTDLKCHPDSAFVLPR